jgi:hypothetical protein
LAAKEEHSAAKPLIVVIGVICVTLKTYQHLVNLRRNRIGIATISCKRVRRKVVYCHHSTISQARSRN